GDPADGGRRVRQGARGRGQVDRAAPLRRGPWVRQPLERQLRSSRGRRRLGADAAILGRASARAVVLLAVLTLHGRWLIDPRWRGTHRAMLRLARYQLSGLGLLAFTLVIGCVDDTTPIITGSETSAEQEGDGDGDPGDGDGDTGDGDGD